MPNEPLPALFIVQRPKAPPVVLPVRFNPTELNFSKAAQIAEIDIPGLDAPIQQFVRGQAEKMTVELFFDTTEKGMGVGATSVTTETDRIFELIRIDSE